MYGSQHTPPLNDLKDALDITGRVIQEGDHHAKVTGLCMMAHIVSKYPPGLLQDLAEDMLSSFIFEAGVSSEDIVLIRHFRTGEE
ncbi:MAG: hypothetical protein JWP20_648 [Roseomonas sp.]|jgi:hypothetical protein|nr:hypothetical protein [Roseomonas sp.]